MVRVKKCAKKTGRPHKQLWRPFSNRKPQEPEEDRSEVIAGMKATKAETKKRVEDLNDELQCIIDDAVQQGVEHPDLTQKSYFIKTCEDAIKLLDTNPWFTPDWDHHAVNIVKSELLQKLISIADVIQQHNDPDNEDESLFPLREKIAEKVDSLIATVKEEVEHEEIYGEDKKDGEELLLLDDNVEVEHIAKKRKIETTPLAVIAKDLLDEWESFENSRWDCNIAPRQCNKCYHWMTDRELLNYECAECGDNGYNSD